VNIQLEARLTIVARLANRRIEVSISHDGGMAVAIVLPPLGDPKRSGLGAGMYE
jgi:hypothetical protein